MINAIVSCRKPYLIRTFLGGVVLSAGVYVVAIVMGVLV